MSLSVSLILRQFMTLFRWHFIDFAYDAKCKTDQWILTARVAAALSITLRIVHSRRQTVRLRTSPVFWVMQRRIGLINVIAPNTPLIIMVWKWSSSVFPFVRVALTPLNSLHKTARCWKRHAIARDHKSCCSLKFHPNLSNTSARWVMSMLLVFWLW